MVSFIHGQIQSKQLHLHPHLQLTDLSHNLKLDRKMKLFVKPIHQQHFLVRL